MLIRPFEMPWRKAYEVWAAGAWAVGVLYFLYLAASGVVSPAMGVGLAAGAMAMGIHRVWQALKVLTTRASLSGRSMQVMTTRELERLTRKPDDLFLGFGFEWHAKHSQRLYELSKVDYKDYRVPKALLPLLGFTSNTQPESEIGLPFIHGVETHETALYRPLRNFEGGTLLVGTTQAGKGVAISSLAYQAIRRGDVVVIIDPKNSKRLKRVVQRACEDFREPDTFVEFHPAFPERGVRLDFTRNWQKVTEIASRIQSIMPADSGVFNAFGWDAINVVAQGLVQLDDRPTLLKLKKYVEGGIEQILEKLLDRFFTERLGTNYRSAIPEMAAAISQAQSGKLRRSSENASHLLTAFVHYYQTHVAQAAHDPVIDSQLRVLLHPREHYQKIIANLLPILSMLTSGALGKSLSPEAFDMSDSRPILDFEKIEGGRHVLYMCLDSLPDPSVASAIGALAIADLAARAGIRYNLGSSGRFTLIVDEISNVVNQPLIEILNKGAEGGMMAICAMQTLADLADRLGSEDAARKALGNLNNLFALRSKDRLTQDFIAETFGKTGIHTLRVGMNEGADTSLGSWSAGRSIQITEAMEERVPVDMIGKLPNLQYFGSIAGRLVKGRFPILNPDFDRPSEEAA
jgi:conjugal transfer pilus assembly protein TraD